MSQYSLSVLCHFVALAGCIRPGYVGGQLVITRNILSFFSQSLLLLLLNDPKAMCLSRGSFD